MSQPKPKTEPIVSPSQLPVPTDSLIVSILTPKKALISSTPITTTMSSMSPSARPLSKQLELDLTIISAKHLKNINWRRGDLKPLVTLWLDPSRRLSTKPDDHGSTRPVWNERFLIPITSPLQETLLSLEISHSDSPVPLVGSLQFLLRDHFDSPDSNSPIRTLELRRPSGRPQGKVRVKLGLRERPPPDYHNSPPSYYYSSAPPPPPPTRYSPSPYSAHMPPPSPAVPPPVSSPYTYGSYSDPYPGYYSGYYSHPPPPPPPRPFLDQSSSSYSGYLDHVSGYARPSGPSAPVDYSAPYDHKEKGVGSKIGVGGAAAAGLGMGAVVGGLGGLALDEGLKYEDDKISDRAEKDLARDDYNDYRPIY